METFPDEIKYKIMSNLPPDKLVGLTNKAMFQLYCDRWGRKKWDSSVNWHEEFAKKFNKHFMSCTDAFAIQLPWDEHVDWASVANIIPDELPTNPEDDDYFYKYTNDVWQKIFDGDKELYKQLIADLSEPLQLETAIYDGDLRYYMLQHAIAVILWKWDDQADYLRMFLQMIFTGSNEIEYFACEIILLTHHVDILRKYNASTALEWFVEDVGEELSCVTDIRYWKNDNFDLYEQTKGLLYIAPYFKRDLRQVAYDNVDLPDDDAEFVDANGSRTKALRQFYTVLLASYTYPIVG